MRIIRQPPPKGAFLYTMFRRLWTFAFFLFMLNCISLPADADTLGPAASYAELHDLLLKASSGDTIVISDDISALDAPPLHIPVSVRIKSDDSDAIRGLQLVDSSVAFSDISMTDTLSISGTSHILLGKNVFVTGSPAGTAALSFSGCGTLIVEGGCTIAGSSGSDALSIQHQGGEFYGSIEGIIRGGSGTTGGSGLIISPLQNNGALMITGSISGGDGDHIGGHALNLYDLSGNACITVDGHMTGGSGLIGGNGIQIVSTRDNVSVGVNGFAKGGSGENYGGDALILMNPQDASSFHISGHFSGGDALGEGGHPGTSIQLVGNAAAARARIENCILEDGKPFKPTPMPTAAPTLVPTAEPTIEPNTPSTSEPELTPAPSIEPTAQEDQKIPADSASL